ncbi:UvrD-helicase domain-containing protein [Lutibacter flavus]|uniref:DNA 3'-5' helicase n=1 Tax=Lutibacter flavus TaxID=691689 RepID=A0A238WY78_9FLAO|nr:UvrD-helicase domain-containing protein [Lutibacter flavus]SNR51378.1 ATP-dependent exoDNAse (exonuclease V) beta subunit (contains helicase and exonuclease domains) [Lutibacter flavus]
MQDQIPFQIYSASAGSGKTFTLVKEYLKILLKSTNPFKFQQILAVTFTNKAAGEMKERVIENLKTFSNYKTNDMLLTICKEANLTKEVVFENSKIILNSILQNYSAFNITTIDSFTHKIIRTFAHDLKLPMNFEVEMDAESLLNEAVDIVISKIGEDKDLTNLLVNYSIQKLDDDKAWDISLELKDFAKIILNENHSSHLKSLGEVSIGEFKKLKEKLQKENKQILEKFKAIGVNGINIIKENGIENNEFSYGDLPNHFIKLINLKHLKPDELKFEGRLNKAIEENKNLYAGKCNASTKQIIDGLSVELKELYSSSKVLYNEIYGDYILNSIIVESLIPLAVLNYINTALQELKSENNILLNAEFNQLISDTIKDEPAPFIYERLGEKFRYYFLDEMQDTSELQWKNLIPLIENAITSENEVGEKGKLLLVGDAKQSIYRWRGGNPEQFIALSSEEKNESSNPFFVDKYLSNLETNFRSYSEIIEFNNSFFKYISQFLTNKNYCNLYFDGNDQKNNSNIGGFVQLSFIEKEKDDEEKDLVYPKKVLEIIQNIDPSFQKNEACVLVRTKKQGIAVANYLSENKIEIISSETLLLKNNEKIDFIINLLNVFESPLNKEYKVKLLYFLYNYLNLEISKHQFLSGFIDLSNEAFFNELKQFNQFFNCDEFIRSPFYESFEYIIRSFNLAPESDSDIQFFLDFVFEFQQKKQASINGFLEVWELKKDKLSIVAPEAKNAVRILTIHKAKGLEFPIVIYPYDIDIYNQIKPKVWYNYEQSSTINSVLVNYSNKLNYVGDKGEYLFNKRREELELDNFNILYVALTRAVEQLYIVSEKKTSSKNESDIKFSSSLFINYLKQQDLWNPEKLDYTFGSQKRFNISKKEESVTTTQKSFISNSWKNHNISIVANSSLLWDTDQGKAIIYGNLIHEILSFIKTNNDIYDVVHQYLFKGIITENEKEEIIYVLNKIVNHKELSKYFNQNNKVYNEQEILTNDKRIIIPDRLVFNENKVTIIDYKTGITNNKYHEQINNYGTILEELNFKIEKKLLVYINEEITIEEV